MLTVSKAIICILVSLLFGFTMGDSLWRSLKNMGMDLTNKHWWQIIWAFSSLLLSLALFAYCQYWVLFHSNA